MKILKNLASICPFREGQWNKPMEWKTRMQETKHPSKQTNKKKKKGKEEKV